MQPERWGAAPEDWHRFRRSTGIGEHLLPVVCNKAAGLSPGSSLRSLGKVPSRYNTDRQVVGFAKWPAYRATDADLEDWSKEPDYGICIQGRYVRAIDVDVDDDKVATMIELRLLGLLGALPVRRRDNAHRFLIAFRLPGTFSKRILRTKWGRVEFLADGQQFVAIGTHPSGGRYTWDPGVPEQFRAIDVETFETAWSTLERELGGEATIPERSAVTKAPDPVDDLDRAAALARVNAETVRDLESALSKLDATDYETWIRTGQALKSLAEAGLEGEGKTLWLSFSERDPRFDLEESEAKWQSFTAERTDFRAVFAAAQRAGWVNTSTRPAVSAKPKAFEFRPWSACDSALPTEWLIKGVLPRAELGMVYGESGSGKTFLVLDAVASVARGSPWRGRRVRRGRVVYIAAEGAGGFRSRVKAYRQHHGVDDVDSVMILEAAPNLLHDPSSLIEAVRSLGHVDLVVFDTFARTTPGANENSAEDMGAALAHCKAIHDATAATVLLVHHAGKDAAKGARGWSGIKAACDFEIEVSRDKDLRCATVTKLKDGNDGERFWFRLNTVDLGRDADGDEVTSCVVTPAESPAPALARGGKWQRHLQAALTDLAGLTEDGVPRETVVAQAVSLEPKPKGRDRRREYVAETVTELVEKGVLEEVNGLLWFAGSRKSESRK